MAIARLHVKKVKIENM